jgi:chromosome segregation ATPase
MSQVAIFIEHRATGSFDDFKKFHNRGSIMTEKTHLPNVSMANTKKELLEAYEEAKKRFETVSKDLLDAEKARKRLEKKVATATADAQAAQDPLKRLHDLRGTISRELTELAERFETEIETYRKIQSAIETKNEELNTIYEVETAASDLAALIDAQRVKKEQFEREMQAQEAAFEAEREETRTQWQREKADWDRRFKEQTEAIEKQRQREKEEYEYTFARDKAQRKNTLDDELQALEKELAAKRSEFEHEVQNRKAELDTREEAIKVREKEMDTLQKEVESFPKRNEAAVEQAVTDARERLTRSFKADEALMEARFEGERNVLMGKIEALEKMVASQAAQISDLAKKNELAYEKVQDIANRAVTSARRDTYSAPIQQPNIAVREES